MYLKNRHVILVLILSCNGATQLPNCDVQVDINDGIRDGANIIKDGVSYTEKDYFSSDGVVKGCICHVKQCIRKCCLENQVLNLTTKTCTEGSDQDLINQFRNYNIINVPDNKLCEDVKIRVRLDSDFEIVGSALVWNSFTFKMEDFCLSTAEGRTYAVGCIPKDSDKQVSEYTKSTGMIISMPFLALTFLVYLILPEKNLHRVSLMCYVLSLLLGYICLVTVQLAGVLGDVMCHTLGFGIIFFFLISFFWMNVMCIDMWLTFSGSRGFSGKRDAERKRFLYYCLYAFGMPTLHILVVFLLNTYGDRTAIYHPKIGIGKCFLDNEYPNLFYFYGPIGVLIGINLVLFVLTTIKIHKVKKETKMLKHTDSQRHSYDDDKQKFNLYLKLTLAMGINWTMEVISWACLWKLKVLPDAVWYLTDLCNALYGVFIFIIFVAKKKIWNNLKRRYYIFIGKPMLAQTITSSQMNRTSTTDTNTSSDNHRLQEIRGSRKESRPLNGH